MNVAGHDLKSSLATGSGRDARALATAVSGLPRILLRLEGGLLLSGSTLAFAHLNGSWWLFAALFLTPDLFMIGYAVGAKAGAVLYNAAHTTLAPAVVLFAAALSPSDGALAIGLIWLAHIGFDRLLGFGLKYANGFRSTHLGAPAAGT